MTNMVPGVVYQFYARPNGDMGFYYISPKSEQVIGLKPELDGYLQRVIELIIPEHRDGFVRSIETSVKESTEWKYEGMLQKPSGEKIWFSGNSTPSPREDEIVFNGIVQDITERKHAEQELQKIANVVSYSSELVNLSNLDGTMIFLNEAGAKMLGISVAEVEQTNIMQVIPPHFIEMVENELIPALLKTGHWTGELQYLNLMTHQHVDVHATTFVIKDQKTGAPLYFANVSLDITARKQAEEALRKSEEKYRTLAESSPEMIYLIDDRGFVKYLNPAAAAMFPRGAGAVEGRNLADLYPPEIAKRHFEAIRSVISSGKCFSSELLEHFPSQDRWIDARLSPVRNSAGRIVEVLGLSQDITDRKRAEEALRKSENKYRTIVENITDALYVHDFKGCISDCSEAACRMTGYSRAELIGQPLSLIDSDENKRLLPERMQRLMQDNMIVFEGSHIRKDGSAVAIEVCGKVVSRDQDGLIQGFVRDISDRKRTEELLANAQKLESLGVLAGGIAHDFNNLMGGIFGYIEMANGASTEAHVKQDLAKVMQTIDRARALTQQLLTFAKGGSPIQEVSPLFPFVQQTAHFALSGSNVSCRFDITDGLWPANYDKNQIGQIIDNLIINAQQAMPLGGTIVFSARNVALADSEHPLLKKGDYVRLSVIDTGIGIPKELQKRIFDPFFTTKAKGHGLGLATCYSIINRHGGCIDVFSEPGKGSTFNVYLPAAREVVTNSNDVHIKEHQGNGTFLVMDDEEVIRETVSSMLRTFGYKVVCKVNGQEAIDYVASRIRDNQTIAGMLFDLTVLGAMGGKEAIEQMRKMGVHIPAFVSSGYADDPIIRNPAEHGFTASICKPFMRSELMEMLEKHMKGKE